MQFERNQNSLYGMDFQLSPQILHGSNNFAEQSHEFSWKGLMRMGNVLEYLDVYDAGLQHIGVVERQLAHRKGYWHKTFHWWVLCERSTNAPSSSNDAMLPKIRFRTNSM